MISHLKIQMGWVAVVGLVVLVGEGLMVAAPAGVNLTQAATNVPAYDFLELTLSVDGPDAPNPFTDVAVGAEFGKTQEAARQKVSGFCDSEDGKIFRVRLMPASAGDYTFTVQYRQRTFQKTFTGRFQASDQKRRGLLAVDPAYSFHFIWQGTGEHFYFNGTTAFLLLGWDDESVIQRVLDRYQRYKINRVRLLLTGRTDHFWTEPVKGGSGFKPYLNPWPAQRPESIDDPGFDYTRFNPSYWQKFERMLRHARDLDINISIIMDWNDTKPHTAPGSEDEHRYYRYAVDRLGGFSNVTWDLGDDLDSFRDDAWTRAAGNFITGADPYHHLTTSHPVNNVHQDRTSPWFAFTSFQYWTRPLHEWMLDQRKQQEKTGHFIPQTDEEYGYEDHYPEWNPVPAPGCSADGCRRAAWDIAMTGAYQTTGETAKRGTGVPPDTGGGWINGRADETMILPEMQSHMVDFFTSFEWWKTAPHDELAGPGTYCLAEPGLTYAVYLPHGGSTTVKLGPGTYRAEWFHARSGEVIPIGQVRGPQWTSPKAADLDDWALLLRKVEARN